ncbi:unnamed protein product [Acanthoscelides obtectus]|nr:unnamed protein product [Acanthoscelides obtectus]CAK1667319.1 hypothetical protein AOBTE_LOCUS25776 [Acanthoscelides obtectus]
MPGGQTLLTVRNVTLLEQGQTVVANWSLDENLQSCVHFYRLVYWDDFSEVPKDVYMTNTSYTIPNVVPCSKYNVKVSAWTSPTQEGPVATAAYTTIAKPSAQPHIFNLVVDKHAAEMVWHLPEYHCNRCPISKVIVDATPQFKLTIPYQDSPLRPDVVINLTNLTESTVYKCDVYLQNNAGLSPPVHVLIQTHYEPTPPPPTSPTPAPTPPTPPPTSPTPAPTPPTPAPTPPPTPAPAPPAPNPLNPPRPLSPH